MAYNPLDERCNQTRVLPTDEKEGKKQNNNDDDGDDDGLVK